MNLKCKIGIHDFGVNGQHKVRKCYRCGAEVKKYDRRKNTYHLLFVLQIIIIAILFQMVGVIDGLIVCALFFLFLVFGETRELYKKVKK